MNELLFMNDYELWISYKSSDLLSGFIWKLKYWILYWILSIIYNARNIYDKSTSFKLLQPDSAEIEQGRRTLVLYYFFKYGNFWMNLALFNWSSKFMNLCCFALCHAPSGTMFMTILEETPMLICLGLTSCTIFIPFYF